jgi:ABC-type lipoprotein export system ATPase subunit
VFGFLGPNGAGKTTTIRILATLLRPTAGTAQEAGFDVAAKPHEVRKRLGLAMQAPTLDAFSTGRETLELAGRLHRMRAAEVKSRANELLELMGLTSAAKKLTGTYSGGMKRRLDLAAAMMHRPEVLILDEPTEGLDPQSRAALWEELERISKAGTTMLLTTHYGAPSGKSGLPRTRKGNPTGPWVPSRLLPIAVVSPWNVARYGVSSGPKGCAGAACAPGPRASIPTLPQKNGGGRPLYPAAR